MSSAQRFSRAGRIAAAALGAAVLALGGGLAVAQVPALPKSPVTINIVDVAGNLALTQDAIEAYQKKHPQLVAKINLTKAPAPELPGKLKAMQGAGRSDIDMVLTGTDFLAAGIEQGVLVKILPQYAAKFPNLMSQLPASRSENAGAGRRLRRHRNLHAGRPAARVQP